MTPNKLFTTAAFVAVAAVGGAPAFAQSHDRDRGRHESAHAAGRAAPRESGRSVEQSRSVAGPAAPQEVARSFDRGRVGVVHPDAGGRVVGRAVPRTTRLSMRLVTRRVTCRIITRRALSHRTSSESFRIGRMFTARLSVWVSLMSPRLATTIRMPTPRLPDTSPQFLGDRTAEFASWTLRVTPPCSRTDITLASWTTSMACSST